MLFLQMNENLSVISDNDSETQNSESLEDSNTGENSNDAVVTIMKVIALKGNKMKMRHLNLLSQQKKQ